MLFIIVVNKHAKSVGTCAMKSRHLRRYVLPDFSKFLKATGASGVESVLGLRGIQILSMRWIMLIHQQPG